MEMGKHRWNTATWRLTSGPINSLVSRANNANQSTCSSGDVRSQVVEAVLLTQALISSIRMSTSN